MLRDHLKNWLEKRAWYLNLRYAKPVINAWLRIRPSVRNTLHRRMIFYAGLMNDIPASSRLVFDIGAHEGFLSAIFLHSGCKVVAIEPSARNLRLLHSRFARNEDMIIVAAAVSDQAGELSFFDAEKGHAYGTANEKWKQKVTDTIEEVSYVSAARKVKAVTIDMLVKRFGCPCFCKIDVEGYEEKVIRGLSEKIPLISFEAILPDFLEETMRSIYYLEQLGDNVFFNYVKEDKFELSEVVRADQMVKEIQGLAPQTIEIFCKTVL